MSDGTSGGIFGELLHYAFEKQDLDLVTKLFDLGMGHDFAWCDYDVDHILASAGLARMVWHKRWKEWETVYRGDPDFSGAEEWKPYNERETP